MKENERKERLNKEEGRTTYNDDGERISHSNALRRLAGVTQVINATEGEVYHNRLTHTIKVSRIARLIAQNLLESNQKEALEKIGGLDVSVVEAAALAHDIGHPPFGHCGEQELNRLVLYHGWGIKDPEKEKIADIVRERIDGFEGNAQSFRVVTKLAPRHTSWPGLNLTRATLNGMLKYPWLRSQAHSKKYGAYYTEETNFNWARSASDLVPEQRTLEAEIMDWSDDVAYATHDLEDFYRAGLIDLDRIAYYFELLRDKERLAQVRTNAELAELRNIMELSELSDNAELKQLHQKAEQAQLREKAELAQLSEKVEKEVQRYRHEFIDFINSLDPKVVGRKPEATLRLLIDLMPFRSTFAGTLAEQNVIREVFSGLIENYIAKFNIRDGKIALKENIRFEVEIFKQFTIYFVIQSRALQTQQHGEEKIIRYIFECYYDAAKKIQFSDDKYEKRSSILPPDFHEILKAEIALNERNFPPDLLRARVVADVISRMTDEDALRMYQRLSGNTPGSIFDRIT